MPAAPDLCTFVQYLLHFAADRKQIGMTKVISGTFVRLAVSDNRVKFRDPRLNCSPEIQPEAVGGGSFDRK